MMACAFQLIDRVQRGRPAAPAVAAVVAMAVVVAWGLLPVRAAALDIHSIQIGRYATSAEAEQARQAASASCSPAFVREDKAYADKPYALLVGHFPYYAEAWVSMKKLRDQGTYPACEVATWEWDGRTLEQSFLPIEFPFDTTGLENVAGIDPEAYWAAVGLAGQPEPDAALLVKSPAEMTREELLDVGLHASDKAVAVPALQRFLSAYPGAPETNRARLRLARLTGCNGTDDAYALLAAIRTDGTDEEKALTDLIEAYMLTCRGNRAEAMTAFRALANNTALAPSLRLEAMQRVARHAHALRDYPAAWLAFEQIEQTAPDAATAADARMQRSGFAFELVLREKGSWDDTRRLCKSVDSVEGAPAPPRATARLMFVETFFQEKDYDRTIEEADRLITDFPAIDRERVTAMYWKARSLEESYRNDEALTVFAAIHNEPIMPEALFPALNAKAKGLFHQARLYQRKGNDAAAQAAAQELIQTYPSSYEAKAYLAGEELPD